MTGKFRAPAVSYWFPRVSFVLRCSVIGGAAVQVVRRVGGAGEAKTNSLEAANRLTMSDTSKEPCLRSRYRLIRVLFLYSLFKTFS